MYLFIYIVNFVTYKLFINTKTITDFSVKTYGSYSFLAKFFSLYV